MLGDGVPPTCMLNMFTSVSEGCSGERRRRCGGQLCQRAQLKAGRGMGRGTEGMGDEGRMDGRKAKGGTREDVFGRKL